MTITARYASTCPTCRAAITPGQQVEWSRGTPARHVGCAGGATSSRTAAPATARRRTARPGKWTGCSCGSREDAGGDLIPSSRNCASCEHDA